MEKALQLLGKHRGSLRRRLRTDRIAQGWRVNRLRIDTSIVHGARERPPLFSRQRVRRRLPFRTPTMERAEYLKLAEVEDRMWYFRCLHRRAHDALVHGLPNPHGAQRLLDAGCGTGGFLRRLRSWEPAWTCTGADVEPLACDIARERGCDVAEASILALPFAEGTFDAITCVDVLYHISEHVEALREFRRCLRPGGVLVVNVPAYRWLWSYHDERVQSKHRFSRPELVRLAGQAGLRVVRSTYWNTLPFPLVVARRKLFPPRNAESDVKLQPAPVEAAFDAAMAVERAWTGMGGRLPFGSSVFVVARRE